MPRVGVKIREKLLICDVQELFNVRNMFVLIFPLFRSLEKKIQRLEFFRGKFF